jgi:hypothetical protein
MMPLQAETIGRRADPSGVGSEDQDTPAGNWLGLPLGLRQTVKTLFTVR